MLNFIEDRLSSFRFCFSRSATSRWFVVVIVGLMARTDFLGVTSIIRCLAVSPSCYESLLHFFRSDAFSIRHLRQTLYRLVSQSGFLFTLNSHALPLNMGIQDGLSGTASWNSGNASRALFHVIQMVRNGYEAASTLGLSYLVLDRYFLSVPALEELDRLNHNCHLLDIVTRAKSSCTAYELPKNTVCRRGRPRKKGSPVKLNTLFQSRVSGFTRTQVLMYGKKETASL